MPVTTTINSDDYQATNPNVDDADNRKVDPFGFQFWFEDGTIITADFMNSLIDNVAYAGEQVGVTPNGYEDDTYIERIVDAYIAARTSGDRLAASTTLLDFNEDASDRKDAGEDGQSGNVEGYMRITDDGEGWRYSKYSFGQTRDLLFNNDSYADVIGTGITLSNDISSYKVLEFHMEDGYVPFYTIPIEALEEWGSDYEGCILVRDRNTWISVKRITAGGKEYILFEKDPSVIDDYKCRRIYGVK